MHYVRVVGLRPEKKLTVSSLQSSCLHHRSVFVLAQEQLDFIQQGGEEIFFLQASRDFVAAIHWSISGNDDDRYGRVPFMDFASQFQSVHAFHAEIGYQEIKILFFKFPQGIGGVERAHGTVTLHFQNFAAEPRQYFMIVNEQDGFHERLLMQTGLASCRSGKGKGSANGLLCLVSQKT